MILPNRSPAKDARSQASMQVESLDVREGFLGMDAKKPALQRLQAVGGICGRESG